MHRVLRPHPTSNGFVVVATVSRQREAESLRKKNPGTVTQKVGAGRVTIVPVNPFPPIRGARTATSRGFAAVPVQFTAKEG